MVLELGPLPTADVLKWNKFARRIIVELRSSPDVADLVSTDVIELWSRTLTEWTGTAQQAEGSELPFRWTSDLEPEVVEFLLDGLDKCLHSPVVMSWVTAAEASDQRPVTMAIVRAFVDGLIAESNSCQHYADQILSSLGPLLSEN
jgi:hypothetical protein